MAEGSSFNEARLEKLNAELTEQVGDMEGYIEELESTVATLAYQLAECEGHGA